MSEFLDLYQDLVNANAEWHLKRGKPPTHVYLKKADRDLLQREAFGLEHEVAGMIVVPLEEFPENAKGIRFFVT